MANTATVQELMDMVAKFSDERDWVKYHNPKDLAIGLSTEANELLDIFRFQNGEDLDRIMQDPKHRTHVKEELADSLFFILEFARLNDINLKEILEDKIAKNSVKYPVEKAKGLNKKYDEL